MFTKLFLQLDERLLLSNSFKAKPLFNVADLFIVIFIVSRAFVTPASAMPPTVINILTLFEVSLQPYCSTGCDSGIFCTAATALFTTVKTLSMAALNSLNLQLPQTQPFHSSFAALLEVTKLIKSLRMDCK